MECHEGATMIKTFRGKMLDDTIDVISLHTNDGSMGYRIVKFMVMPTTDDTVESVLQVYSTLQTTTTADIDFSDQTLLAAAYFSQSSATNDYPEDITVFFDHVTFNQDIYITLKGHSYTAPMNYYLELEQVKLDINANTVATLKDMRNTASPRP
jgi:hypothetical protein